MSGPEEREGEGVFSFDEKREEWNEAALRARRYLQALGIQDEVGLLEAQRSVLLLALEQQKKDPGISPVEQTYVELRKFLARDLQKGLSLEKIPEKDAFFESLLAFKVSKAQAKPAEHPGELFAGPSLGITDMTPRPMDYGPLPELERMGRTRWLPVLYAFLIWLAIYGLGYTALSYFIHE